MGNLCPGAQGWQKADPLEETVSPVGDPCSTGSSGKGLAGLQSQTAWVRSCRCLSSWALS